MQSYYMHTFVLPLPKSRYRLFYSMKELPHSTRVQLHQSPTCPYLWILYIYRRNLFMFQLPCFSIKDQFFLDSWYMYGKKGTIFLKRLHILFSAKILNERVIIDSIFCHTFYWGLGLYKLKNRKCYLKWWQCGSSENLYSVR